MYSPTARAFLSWIEKVFTSEQTLKEEFSRHFGGLTFDRTDHWSAIFRKILTDCWYEYGPAATSPLVPYDIRQIMRELHPLLDYNLFTQIYCNLQEYGGISYAVSDAEKEIEKLKETWSKDSTLDPFAPKAKMVKQAEIRSKEQIEYNAVISTLRALRIISQFGPQVSFRVSPIGSTPSLTDSRNLSMIGLGGDKYLRTVPSLNFFYFTWEQIPTLTAMKGTSSEGVIIQAEGIPYYFLSKSGGEILNEVLFTRKVMYDFLALVYGKSPDVALTFIPRVKSLLVVHPANAEWLPTVQDAIHNKFPMVSVQTIRQQTIHS
jgi:hypothetical protein